MSPELNENNLGCPCEPTNPEKEGASERRSVGGRGRGELKLSSKRRGIDRRRRRKSQTPAAEALSTLFGWRCRRGEERRGSAPGRAGPSRARPRWALAAAKQPRCNNSGTGGLKGDSLAGIGLQPRRPTLVDAETSPQTGGPECNRCKGSFPVYQCLCVQTCGESAVETR